jgi:hypothetical protein
MKRQYLCYALLLILLLAGCNHPSTQRLYGSAKSCDTAAFVEEYGRFANPATQIGLMDGKTPSPLHFAAAYGCKDIIDFLLNERVRVNLKMQMATHRSGTPSVKVGHPL